MKHGYLIDTHAFIESSSKKPGLKGDALKAFQDPRAPVYVSMASFWEMMIKISLGKLKLESSVQHYAELAVEKGGMRILGIELPHIMEVGELEHHHGDPFDRLLVAQAKHESLAIISRDPALDSYGIERIW